MTDQMERLTKAPNGASPGVPLFDDVAVELKSPELIVGPTARSYMGPEVPGYGDPISSG